MYSSFSSLTRLALLALVSIHSLCLAKPTQVMRRPENFKNEVHHGPEKRGVKLEERAGGKVQMGYFTNWGIYGRNFQPTDVVVSTLSHILYAFADVDPNSGNIILTDLYADEQKHFPTDSWSETGNNLYGCLKQLYLLKLANRNLKVLLSVGGWTYSQANHFSFVTNAAYRSTFVSSAVSMIENLGLDGIDLDFEYPSNTDQGEGFAALITSLRTAFDQLASKKGDTTPYQITAAVSAGAANSAFLDVPAMDKALTYWNLMAYDFAGSWSTVSDNQANLYGGQGFSNVSGDAAFKSYVSRGATAGKINLGMPIYGRGFDQTASLHQPYTGVGTGTWEAGVWDYKALPMAGATVVEDSTTVSSYSYDSSKQELISYDTPNIVRKKAQYVAANGMAGSMFWELSADKIGADSLVGTSLSVYGSKDTTQNHINYPDSTFANIANNMGTSPGSPPTTSPSSTPTSTPTSTTTSSGSTPTTGSCNGIAAWSSGIAYAGGQQVTYSEFQRCTLEAQGLMRFAKMVTFGQPSGGLKQTPQGVQVCTTFTPTNIISLKGSIAGVWTDNGAC